MKSAVKKLIVIGCIVAVLCVGALIDFAISLTYKIEFVSVVRLTESGEPVTDGGEVPADWGIADGSTKVRFVVRVTHGGKPVSGHTLYVKTNRNVLERTDTDGEGIVTVDYRCYRAGTGKVTPVVLTVRDEDNSVFVFVPAEASYTLSMAAGEGESGSGMTTDDIFYDIDAGKEN